MLTWALRSVSAERVKNHWNQIIRIFFPQLIQEANKQVFFGGLMNGKNAFWPGRKFRFYGSLLNKNSPRDPVPCQRQVIIWWLSVNWWFSWANLRRDWANFSSPPVSHFHPRLFSSPFFRKEIRYFSMNNSRFRSVKSFAVVAMTL